MQDILEIQGCQRYNIGVRFGSSLHGKEHQMIIREDAIYGRQSVDRKDSISIESQIEF